MVFEEKAKSDVNFSFFVKGYYICTMPIWYLPKYQLNSGIFDM